MPSGVPEDSASPRPRVDSRLAGFFQSHDWTVVRQGVEIAAALGDLSTLEGLCSGVAIDEDGAVVFDERWATQNCIRAPVRENLALLLLSLAPRSALADVAALDLAGCEGLTDLGPLRVASKLRRLRLDGCRSLRDAEPLGDLPALQFLSATDCGVGAHLPSKGLEGLESLAIDLAEATSIAPLARCTRLRRLTIHKSHMLRDLSPLHNLRHLETLRIVGMATPDLEPIGTLSALRTLVIEGVPDGADPMPLSKLSELRRLTIGPWARLDLSRLLPEGSLPLLEALDLSEVEADGLGGFAEIRGAPSLAEFCSPRSLPHPAGPDIRDLIRLVLPDSVRPAQEGSGASLVLGATMMIDAVLTVGSKAGSWPRLQTTFDAAMQRAGPRLASAMLGATIRKGDRLLAASSSPIRRLAERTGGDWIDEAVPYLAQAST